MQSSLFYRKGWSIYIILFLWIFCACSSTTPEPVCEAGSFVMTLKNQDGKIMFDSLVNSYAVKFSTDGSLAYNLVAVPCRLSAEFRGDFDVVFDGDIFGYSPDGSNAFNKSYFKMDVKNMKYQ